MFGKKIHCENIVFVENFRSFSGDRLACSKDLRRSIIWQHLVCHFVVPVLWHCSIIDVDRKLIADQKQLVDSVSDFQRKLI